jgi:hypothetical protein
VDVLALLPNTSKFNKLTAINFLRSAAFVTILSWDPSSVYNDGSTVNFNWVLLIKSSLKRQLTTLVTVERVDNIETIDLDAINILLPRNQYFFTHI